MRGPTQRSLAMMRETGYTICVVEHYNAFAKKRHDMFGFIDIAGLHPNCSGLLGVQTTTGSNLAARMKKAEALPAYHLWLACGNAVEFHGWRKLKNRGRKQWWPLVRRVEPTDRVIKEGTLFEHITRQELDEMVIQPPPIIDILIADLI